MPGYTHMQPAEAILLSHWWLAGEARFCRDYSRLTDAYKRLNMLPLGANVMAGTREPIDRRMVAISLGFDDVIENSLDAVTDRDYLIEFGSFASLVGVHLSQLGGELLLWVTQEFAFARIPQHMLIESHTLHLKRNPEILEVLRARPALIFGRLMEFMTQLKGITIGFSQDLQECVPGVFEIVETLKILLDLAIGMLPGLEFDQNRMREVACADLVNVSNALDYLLNHGVEREIAGRAVEHLAHYCRTRHKYLSDLALSEWQQYSPAFEADIYDYIAMEESVGAFCSYGGSSKGQVEMAMARSKGHLQKDMAQLAELVAKSSQLSRQTSAPPAP
jgi:argininosuccinate lyase